MVILGLSFWGMTNLFLTLAEQFYILTNNVYNFFLYSFLKEILKWKFNQTF